MNKNKNKDNIFSFGDFLRNKREEADLTLEKLESLTKINIKTLENLENEKFEKMPPKIYIKGIISKYCQHVGLDVKEITAMFDKYFQEDREESFNLRRNAVFNLSGRGEKLKTIDLNKIFIWIFVGLVIIFLFRQVSLMLFPPKIEILNPKEEISYIDTALNLEGRVLRTKYLSINNRPILFDENGHFEYFMVLEPGRNEITIKAQSQLKKETQMTRTVIYQPITE